MKKIIKFLACFLVILVTIFMVNLNLVKAETTGKVVASTVRLRREANTSSDVLELIDENDEVEILGESGDWYRIRYNGLTGYVMQRYISTSGSSSNKVSSANNNVASSANNNTNVNISNSSNSDSEANLANTNTSKNETTQNAVNNIVENNTVSNVVNTNTVSDNTVVSENEQSSASTEFTLSKNANLKVVPSFTSTDINVINSGTKVTVTETLNKWVKITDGKVSGWTVRQNVE